jgi:lysophospholipase L1-like esterase
LYALDSYIWESKILIMKLFCLLLIPFVFLFPKSVDALDSTNFCLKSSAYHIVVLGSSTASGAGASPSDSAWVNRYRTYLESINPNNQVTNLAVGGTTTYHIMPDWFVPPTGRPQPTSNNVSTAINLGADAIIVNMPSNDAAHGFGVDDQLSNFHTIVQTADSFNIPVWICTTQPKANFPLSKDSIQVGVKDSVLSVFGSHSLDFWTTLATPNNKLDSIYDSGDGTHLNNKGHALLFNRVVQKNILSTIHVPISTTDFLFLDYQLLDGNSCGDTNAQVRFVVCNRGIDYTSDVLIQSEVYDHLNQQTMISYDTLWGGLNACSVDTFFHVLNTWQGVTLDMHSFLQTQDSIIYNDTSEIITIHTSGRPSVFAEADTGCSQQSILLEAQSSDLIHWFDGVNSSHILTTGPYFLSPSLQSDTSFWVQSVRGPFVHTAMASASTTSSINWNGVMFNLIAKDTIIVDSLALSSPDLGLQGVAAFIRNGSYRGHETNPNSWSAWGADLFDNQYAGSLYYVDFGTQVLYPNDTLGVYLQMMASNARLQYKSSSGGYVFSSPELDIDCGSGVSSNFANSFPNRLWRGKVAYHYGNNPMGTCASKRVEVKVVVDEPSVSLPTDTTLRVGDTLVLDAGAGFASYIWSTGHSGRYLIIPIDNDWLGSNLIQVQAVNSSFCISTDSIQITVIPTGIEDRTRIVSKVYPNPAYEEIFFNFPTEFQGEKADLRVFNQKGQCVKWVSRYDINHINQLAIQELSSGMYWLEIVIDAESVSRILFVKQ